METFWKITASVLISVILGLFIGKSEKDFAVLLSLTVCCIAAAGITAFLSPVFELLHQLELAGNLQNDMISILLKAVGISIVTDLSGMICQDAGNTALAKTLKILGTSAILYLSIPVFSAFLSLLETLLNGSW